MNHLNSLLRREYLRGLINGQEIKLPEHYDVRLLFNIYKLYIRINGKPKIDASTSKTKTSHKF